MKPLQTLDHVMLWIARGLCTWGALRASYGVLNGGLFLFEHPVADPRFGNPAVIHSQFVTVLMHTGFLALGLAVVSIALWFPSLAFSRALFFLAGAYLFYMGITANHEYDGPLEKDLQMLQWLSLFWVAFRPCRVSTKQLPEAA